MLCGCRKRNFLGVVVVCLWDLIHLPKENNVGRVRAVLIWSMELVLSNRGQKKMTMKKRRMKTMKMTIKKRTIKYDDNKEDDNKKR